MARRYKTAQDLMNMSDSQLKRLYSWRSYEARKKLQRLEQKYGADSQIVRDQKTRFKPLKEMGDLSHRQLAQAAARTYDFGSSKTGQTYENIADKLRDAGFEKVNEENVGATLDFLDDARARGLAAVYGSEGIIEAANRAARQGLQHGGMAEKRGLLDRAGRGEISERKTAGYAATAEEIPVRFFQCLP